MRCATSVARYAIIAAWQDAVGDTGKWSYEDLLPVFMAQEDNDTFHDEYHGVNGGLAVQLPKGINELNQYCLKAFQEYGIPIIPTITARARSASRRCSQRSEISAGAARSMLICVRTSAQAASLLLTGKTVVRILYRGQAGCRHRAEGQRPREDHGRRGRAVGRGHP